MAGTLKTFVLLAAMTALFMAIGYLVGGVVGMAVAFAVALLMNVYSWWNADKIVLRMYGAREVDRNSAPDLVRLVEQLAQRAELPMPKVYIIEQDQPNAFATGRNPENAAVAATTGLLRMLSHEEVAGVMAHELAHVKNRDTLIMTITATLAGAVSALANIAMFAQLFGGNRNSPLGAVGAILVMIVGPIAAMLVQMAISRTREYGADKMGAEICGQPLWLASALEKMQNAAAAVDLETAEARGIPTAPHGPFGPRDEPAGRRIGRRHHPHLRAPGRVTAPAWLSARPSYRRTAWPGAQVPPSFPRR